MKKTNIITLRGKKYDSSTEDLENLGELGHGYVSLVIADIGKILVQCLFAFRTCGTVVKMRFKKTGDVLAVKVSTWDWIVVLICMLILFDGLLDDVDHAQIR